MTKLFMLRINKLRMFVGSSLPTYVTLDFRKFQYGTQFEKTQNELKSQILNKCLKAKELFKITCILLFIQNLVCMPCSKAGR